MKDVNRYTFLLDGKKVYLDSLKIRRELLSATHGRVWAYLRDLAILKDAHKELQDTKENLQDLSKKDREVVEAKLAVAAVSIANLEGTIAEAAYKAFNLLPIDPETGEGTSEVAVLGILSDYMEYVQGKC
jgi:hypothetical protein